MDKPSALLVIAACLIPFQAAPDSDQCHKSACPPMKRSSDAVKQTPAPSRPDGHPFEERVDHPVPE